MKQDVRDVIQAIVASQGPVTVEEALEQVHGKRKNIMKIEDKLLDDVKKIEELYKVDYVPPPVLSKKEIDAMGAIKSIRSIKDFCIDCGERADFQVYRYNKGLPKGYSQDGVRVLGYCSRCIPEDAKREWDEASDMRNWY